jgi:tight adherence protein B
MISFFVFLFCLFATYGSYLLLTRKSAEQRARMERRLAELMLPQTSNRSGEQVKLVKEEFLSEIPLLNNWLQHIGLAARIKKLIEQADLQLTVTRLCMFSALAGLSGWLAVAVLSNSMLLGFCAGMMTAAAPFLHVAWKRNQRLHKFLADLPDALELLGRGLGAGYLFSDALLIAATEMPEPVATEFRRTYDEQNLGLPLNAALENLTQRIPLMELQLCVTAVLIQRETGGNVAEILEKVADTVRDRFRILEDLKTLTTSSRLSAWVLCGIPVLVAVVETIINPEYMSVMWHEPLGQKLAALALVLQLAGILVVRRILQIKI